MPCCSATASARSEWAAHTATTSKPGVASSAGNSVLVPKPTPISATRTGAAGESRMPAPSCDLCCAMASANAALFGIGEDDLGVGVDAGEERVELVALGRGRHRPQ